MAAADVLDERMPGTNDSCAAELFEPAHRPQSRLQASVIGFDRIVSVLLGDMTGRRHQLIKHPRVGGRAVSSDLGRGRPVLEGAGEESSRGRQVPLLDTRTSITCPNWSMARYRYTLWRAKTRCTAVD